MTLAWILLGLRVLATMILYTFLGIAFYIIWRELKQVASLAQPAPQAQLRLIGSAEKSSVWLLDGVTWLGYTPENALVLNDPRVARQACLYQKNGTWWFEDMGVSQNVQLNQGPVSQAKPLTYGDEIKIENVCLRLERIGL